MLIKGGRCHAVLNDELTIVAKIDGSSGEKLRVKGEELVWILIGPERESGGAANHLESILKSVNNILTSKPGLPFGEPGNLGFPIYNGVSDQVVHAAHYRPARTG